MNLVINSGPLSNQTILIIYMRIRYWPFAIGSSCRLNSDESSYGFSFSEAGNKFLKNGEL